MGLKDLMTPASGDGGFPPDRRHYEQRQAYWFVAPIFSFLSFRNLRERRAVQCSNQDSG